MDDYDDDYLDDYPEEGYEGDVSRFLTDELGNFCCAYVYGFAVLSDKWEDRFNPGDACGGMTLDPQSSVDLSDNPKKAWVGYDEISFGDLGSYLLTYLSSTPIDVQEKPDPSKFLDPEKYNGCLREFSLGEFKGGYSENTKGKVLDELRSTPWYTVVNRTYQKNSWESFLERYDLKKHLIHEREFMNFRYPKEPDNYLTVYFFNPLK